VKNAVQHNYSFTKKLIWLLKMQIDLLGNLITIEHEQNHSLSISFTKKLFYQLVRKG
jgi:hypothetical protein